MLKLPATRWFRIVLMEFAVFALGSIATAILYAEVDLKRVDWPIALLNHP